MERSVLQWLVPRVCRERLAVKMAVSLVLLALVLGALGVANGTEMPVGYDRIAGTDWIVLVHTPGSQAFGLVDGITDAGLVVTVLGIGVVALAGFVKLLAQWLGVERERRQRETDLERQQYLLEQTQQLASVGGWELDLRTDPPYTGRLTDELERIHGVAADEGWDMEKGLEFYHPEDRPRVRAAVERAIETGEPYDVEARIVRTDGDERWVRTTGDPVRENGDIVTLRGSLQDITERKQYDLALESLHDATRELLHTETETDICEVVVDIAESIPHIPGVCTYLLDSERNEFVPTAVSPGLLDRSEGPPPLPVGDDDSPAWTAFVTGETVAIEDPLVSSGGIDEAAAERIHTTTRVDPTDVPACLTERIRHGLFVPVGDHGVVAVLSTDDRIDDRTRQLVETLSATTAAAFDRLESESTLRERDEQLQRRNRRLERQIRVTDIIRNVDQSLIDATAREEIGSAVCEQLVESDLISFAWIGKRDQAGEGVTPHAWAGDGHRYLDSAALDGADEPACVTAQTESPTVITSVVDRLRAAPWRRVALEHGFQSVISIPIRHDGYTYGVLTAYAPEPNAFADLERSVFVELGETVGNTINAVQTKQALYGDSSTELKLRFAGDESLLLKLATETDARVELDGLSTDGGDRTRLFFTVTGTDPDDVEATLDRLVTVTDDRAISTTDDGGQFEATVSEGLVASTLVPQGVSPRSMVATGGVLDVVVDVPRETDVRELVQVLQDRYRSVELVARRDVERSIGTKADLVESLLGTLTDRQREVLTTAYYSGFFESPRETNGQEVAAMLDLSQPTVNRHLRLAQRSLLDQLFDTDTTLR